ncbi:sarcocystatin-A [Stomoxys calcitrans]|uniref:sarcocystatin-A n=1 Tax=Stomoxys calcitrans TaxID=35570 RepID=UPI0027E39346|nr:sarcocystatin-A [Stomoxys calcitrans]
MNKVVLVVVLATVCVLSNALDSDVVLKVRGGVRTLEGEDLAKAVEVLKNSLEKIATGEDGQQYKVGKVILATKQPVSGTLYKFDCELIDSNEVPKKCMVKIWSQPWLENGIEVTVDCEQSETLIRSHSA